MLQGKTPEEITAFFRQEAQAANVEAATLLREQDDANNMQMAVRITEALKH
jgi:hypothetical protein